MTLLEVRNLAKSYGAFQAVDDISFRVQPGRCVALLGPNGAGKTTTLKMLSGLLQPSAGTIEFKGFGGGDLRRHIGYLPQYPSFYNWMSAREYMEYAARLSGLSRKEASQRSAELLETVGLGQDGGRRIGGFSGGMKQRLGIAQAMVHSPGLVMLDEPVSALDPIGRREILELMRAMKSKASILFSTHVLHDAEEICDDILIMSNGRIAVDGELKAVRSDNRQPVLLVQTDSGGKQWFSRWADKPYVLEMSCTENSARLVVSDLEQARRDMMQEIVQYEIPVHKFEVARTTLEDLFMKAVGQ